MRTSATAPRRLTAIESPYSRSDFMNFDELGRWLAFNFARSAHVTSFILKKCRWSRSPFQDIKVYLRLGGKCWIVLGSTAVGVTEFWVYLPMEQPSSKVSIDFTIYSKIQLTEACKNQWSLPCMSTHTKLSPTITHNDERQRDVVVADCNRTEKAMDRPCWTTYVSIPAIVRNYSTVRLVHIRKDSYTHAWTTRPINPWNNVSINSTTQRWLDMHWTKPPTGFRRWVTGVPRGIELTRMLL